MSKTTMGLFVFATFAVLAVGSVTAFGFGDEIRNNILAGRFLGTWSYLSGHHRYCQQTKKQCYRKCN